VSPRQHSLRVPYVGRRRPGTRKARQRWRKDTFQRSTDEDWPVASLQSDVETARVGAKREGQRGWGGCHIRATCRSWPSSPFKGQRPKIMKCTNKVRPNEAKSVVEVQNGDSHAGELVCEPEVFKLYVCKRGNQNAAKGLERPPAPLRVWYTAE
jgi:hypothetical protein